MNSSERERLEDILPIYVTGRASAADCSFVQEMLEKSDEVVAMLSHHRLIAQAMKYRAKEAAQKTSAQRPLRARWSWLEPLRGWLRPALPNHAMGGVRGWLRPALPNFAMACMVLVIVGQSVLLMRHEQQDDAGDDLGLAKSTSSQSAAERGASSQQALCSTPKRPLMIINIKDETPELNLRLLLLGLQANIEQGPSQLGNYVVSIHPSGDTSEALVQLQNSEWVNEVRSVKACPRNSNR